MAEGLTAGDRARAAPARRPLAPTAGLAVAMALMGVVGVVAIVSSSAAIETTRWVADSQALLSAITEVERQIAEAEAARRAFSVTGDAADRGRFDAAAARLEAALAETRRSRRVLPSQELRIAELDRALSAQLAFLRDAVAVRAAVGFDLEREVAAARRGVALGAGSRAVAHEIADDERHQLAARGQTELARLRSSRLTTTASAIAALILVGAAFLLARRELGRRNQVEDALRGREETLNLTLAAIPDGIVIFDDDGRIVQVNDQVGQLFGYGDDELIGEPVERLLPDWLASGDPGGGAREQVARRRDGSSFSADVHVSPLVTADGSFAIAAIRDMTERVRVEHELRRLHTAAESANRELESFSYSVAHDLRTPLRAIDGFSQALLEDCGDRLGADGQDHLRRVRAAAQRMARLIDDLLGLSRVSRSEIRRNQVDVTRLARAAVERLRQAEPGREVELTIAEGMVVRADERLVELALDCLLDNAWKFTAGRTPGRVEVFSTEVDGKSVFHVRDNGVGFDMAYVDKLFGVFQRLHGHDQFAGNGVGLATAHRIVLRHGGRIWADAEPDRGATFYFTLS